MATTNDSLKRKQYEKALRELQVELRTLQDWVKEHGERVIVIFEGRDAAGKTLKQKHLPNVRMLCSESYVSHLSDIAVIPWS